MLMLSGLAPSVSAAAPKDKVTICHATDADTHPYVVNQPAEDGDVSGHADHTGPVWDSTLKAAGTKWGDIIPPFTFPGGSYPGLNWDTAGIAIYNNGCKVPGEVTPTPTPTKSHTKSATHTATHTVSESAGVTGVSASRAATTSAAVAGVQVQAPAGPIPAGVNAGQHAVAKTTPLYLGALLMLAGAGGLLVALRPWKRRAH